MLRNLDLDHTGFREALLADGPSTVMPLIQVSRLQLACWLALALCSSSGGGTASGAAACIERCPHSPP